jgi:uncharacterized protein (TIGR02444 family)
VPPACLTFQDVSGVDVNILLFVLFAASRGRMLAATDVAAIMAGIDPWRLAVVVPLRGVRRYLRQCPQGFEAETADALRQRVKAIELEGERLQQEALFAGWPIATLGRAATVAEASRANVEAYASALGVSFDPGAVASLLGAFDTLSFNTRSSDS